MLKSYCFTPEVVVVVVMLVVEVIVEVVEVVEVVVGVKVGRVPSAANFRPVKFNFSMKPD